jgi:hypothetical protein
MSDQTKIYCQAHSMFGVRPCSANDHQNGTDVVWKSRKGTETL